MCALSFCNNKCDYRCDEDEDRYDRCDDDEYDDENDGDGNRYDRCDEEDEDEYGDDGDKYDRLYE